MKTLALLITLAFGLILGCTRSNDTKSNQTQSQKTDSDMTLAWRYLIVSHEQLPGQDKPTSQESWSDWTEIDIKEGNALKSDIPLTHGGTFELSGSPRLLNASQFVIDDFECIMKPYDPTKWFSNFDEFAESHTVEPLKSSRSPRLGSRRAYELSPKLRKTLCPYAKQTSARHHGRDGYRAEITIYVDITLKERKNTRNAEQDAAPLPSESVPSNER